MTQSQVRQATTRQRADECARMMMEVMSMKTYRITANYYKGAGWRGSDTFSCNTLVQLMKINRQIMWGAMNYGLSVIINVRES